MAFLVNAIDKIKRYYSYSPKEVRNLLLAVVIMGFMVSFGEWGSGEQFELITGLSNWLSGIVIVGFAMLVHTSAQRIVALLGGFRGEFQFWLYGLFIGLVVTFVTRGYIWMFLAPGGLQIYHLATHRLGYYRYGLNKEAYGIASMAGPISSVLLAVFFKILLYFFPNNPLLYKAVVVNIWLALITMLPIPPLSGANVFFFSRLTYMWAYGAIIGVCILLALNVAVWAVILGGIVCGWLVWLVFLLGFEKGAWQP